MSGIDTAKKKKIGRLERPALTGVLVREMINFSSFWKSSAFSSTVEPTWRRASERPRSSSP